MAHLFHDERPLSLDDPVRLMRQMSHDMRVPLSTMVATSGLLLEGGYGALSPRQQQAVERISRNGARLVTILDDLMAYVKAQAGEYPVSSREFEPHSLLTTVMEKVKLVAAAKGLTLELIASPPEPRQVVGDNVTISRILLALLWNAVSFTPHGKVSLTSTWLPDHMWSLSVQDTGTGIPDGDIPHIFEPFWSGAERPQVPTSGCGLGLPMALALAHALHGELTLVESSTQGSSFCVKVPVTLAKCGY